MLLSDWLVAAGFGSLFGLVCAWLWIAGSRERVVPLDTFSGVSTPATVYKGRKYRGSLIPDRYQKILLKALSVLGLLGCFVLVQMLGWRDLSRGDFAYILAIETSFPLLLLLTWGVNVWFFYRFLKTESMPEAIAKSIEPCEGSTQDGKSPR